LIIGSVNKIKISTLEKGLKWIQSGAKVLTTCSDVSDPASKGDFNLGMPNHILHLLKYNTIGVKSYSLGKPHPIHAQKIFSNFKDINPKDLLFVGDTIYTDIQLAEENNIKNCLVLTGSSSRDTTKSYIIEPDYIIESIKDLEIFLS
jgi:Predicted sugar phosphatases of the HAD superfamily